MGAIVLLVLTGCNGLRVPLAPPAATDWAQDGGGPNRQSASETVVTPPLREVWRTGVEAGFGPASALVLGDMIVVGTRRGEVVMLSAEDGKRLGRVSLGESVEGGLGRVGDMLYVPIDKGRQGVERIEPATGERQGLVRGSATASALVLPDGRLVISTAKSTLGAFESDADTPVWSYEVGTGRIVTGAVGDARLVVAGDDAGALVALDPATGALRWRRMLAGPLLERPALGDLLFVPTTRGRLLALDPATGTERWRLTLVDTTVRFAAPAIQGDVVALTSTDGHVRLLDARTGTLRWETTLDGAITAAPLLTPEHVYVGTHRKRLVALDRATGAMVWEYTLRGRVKSALAFGAGCLVVLTDARDVLCFRPVPPGAPRS